MLTEERKADQHEMPDEAKRFLVSLLGPNYKTFEYSDEAKAEMRRMVESGELERMWKKYQQEKA